MRDDLVLRNGWILDGGNGPAVRGDLAVSDGRVTHVGGRVELRGRREIDVDGCVITPGFIETRSPADISRDDDGLPDPAVRHGVTTVVVDGFSEVPGRAAEGVTAPLADLGRRERSTNLGILIHLDALRREAREQRVAVEDLVQRAQAIGALGIAIPAGFDADLLPIANAVASSGGSWLRVIDALDPNLAEASEAELFDRWSETVTEWERISVASDLTTVLPMPGRGPAAPLGCRAIDIVRRAAGSIRPAISMPRPTMVFGLEIRTPFDLAPAWRELGANPNGRKLQMLRDATVRQRLIADAELHATIVDVRQVEFVSPGVDQPSVSLSDVADDRGVSPAAAFIELILEGDGDAVAIVDAPVADREMFDLMFESPDVLLVGESTDLASIRRLEPAIPTRLLLETVCARRRWRIERVIRALSADLADSLGWSTRGRLVPGAPADLNVIDVEAMEWASTEFVRDLPGGEGRYRREARGYVLTLVDGQPVVEHDADTGARPGRLLNSG